MDNFLLKSVLKHLFTLAFFFCIPLSNANSISLKKMLFDHREQYASQQEITAVAVKKQMKRVADWQIEHFRDTYSGREKPHHIADWTNGALYVGMTKFAAIADDDRYYNWLKDIGVSQKWELHRRKYMADDHVVGQMYLELYKKYGEQEMLKGTKERLDWIMKNPSDQPITLDNYKHLERWTWCDALFMGPPVWAKLSSITGDQKYTDWMLLEYEVTKQHLFDKEEHLFFRDNSFINKLDNGKKIFWSRGNGWVFGGLTLLMDEYQPGSKPYEYFKEIYLKMAQKLIEIQTPEGHWAMSLLSQDIYPTPETSGTSFFTFGLAWGINNGLLDRSIYEPHIKRAWNSLLGHITEEGMLGYVQPIGAGPDKSFKDKSEVYGTGAFLAAGSEVYKLYGGQPIFQIVDPDYTKSPKTGITRKHWLDMAEYLLEGAFSYVNHIDDPLKFPKLGKVSYPRGEWQVPVEKLEGLSRTLFVATPLLKENPDLEINNIKVADYYRKNILNLIDEKHPSFIKDKEKDWPGQTLVEFGALAISFFSIPEIIWDPLTQEQKDILAKKMISYGDGATVPSNWKFFNIFVLSFFKNQGYEVNDALLEEYLNKSLAHYRGNGWYNDNPAYDYYSMWAFQMYAAYWSEVFGNEYYPEIAKKFKENFIPIKDNYPHMFSKDGKMIMWGRSISYRIASVSPFPFLGFYPEENKNTNWGWIRRISSGVLSQFLQHPKFMKDRVPTLGFYGEFDPATQYYSCRGSTFWMGKAFLSLLLPKENEFWNAIENDGDWETEFKPDKAYNKFFQGAEILLTNYPSIGASEIRAWCHVPVSGVKEPFRGSENYNKLSYNSAFPWQADGKNGEVSMNYMFHTATDSVAHEPGRLYSFKKYLNGVYYRDLKSEIRKDVHLRLADIPLKNGILRIDRISNEKPISFSLGHYALPNINGSIKKSTIRIKGKEVHIIDNGEYQLAMIPIRGWQQIKTIDTKGLNPETEESSVINVSATSKASNDEIFIAAMLWKKSGVPFTKKELSIEKQLKFDKRTKNIRFKMDRESTIQVTY